MKFVRQGEFHVYIVQCSDGTYYTGSTKDLKNRIELHNKCRGAKYVKRKLPVKLVYAKQYKYYKNVLHAERNLKKLTRKQKEKLIRIYEEDNSSLSVQNAPIDLQMQNANQNMGAPESRFEQTSTKENL